MPRKPPLGKLPSSWNKTRALQGMPSGPLGRRSGGLRRQPRRPNAKRSLSNVERIERLRNEKAARGNAVQLSENPVQISSAWIGKFYNFQFLAIIAPLVHTPYPNSIAARGGLHNRTACRLRSAAIRYPSLPGARIDRSSQ